MHLQPVSLMIFSMSFNYLLSLRADIIDLFHFLETLQPFSVGLWCLLNMEHPGRSPHWPQTGWLVHVISYKKWPVQLCWNGISGQVWLFWPVIATLFTWNITFMLHWWENTNIFPVHAHLSACFRIHTSEFDALEMWLLRLARSLKVLFKT